MMTIKNEKFRCDYFYGSARENGCVEMVCVRVCVEYLSAENGVNNTLIVSRVRK